MCCLVLRSNFALLLTIQFASLISSLINISLLLTTLVFHLRGIAPRSHTGRPRTCFVDDLVYIDVEGVALKWFKSYLENRSYHIIINGTKSERRTLHRVVPQGSVLGPVLFSIYTIELAWILNHHSVQFKMFADDTQLYFIINNVEDTISALDSLVVCDLKQWMTKKKLKLNEKKN